MHDHPTPLVIKAAIYKQLCLMATKNSMLASDVLIAMEAIDAGIEQANKEHDEFKGAMSNDK